MWGIDARYGVSFGSSKVKEAIVMAITNGYATVSELQRKLGRAVSGSDTIFSFLEECIERASRSIDEFTGKIYYSKTITAEKVDIFQLSDSGIGIFDHSRMIFPAPIISVSEILEDSTPLTADADYYVYSGQGAIARDGYWTSSRRGISFSGVIGYVSTPKNVNMWCLQVAAALSGRDTATYTDSGGDITEVLKTTVPTWVLEEMKLDRRIFLF